MHTFYTMEHGLSTRVAYTLSEEAFRKRSAALWEPNLTISRIVVPTPADQQPWLDAKNAWLRAMWTPNQDREAREKNHAICEAMEQQMAALQQEP